MSNDVKDIERPPEPPTEPPDGRAVPLTFNDALKRFVLQIDSLGETLPLVMASVVLCRKAAGRRFNSRLKETGTTKDGVAYRVTPERLGSLRLAKRTVELLDTSTDIIPISFLASLISQYDAYIGNLIRIVLLAKPSLLDISDRQLTYAEVFEYESISAARQALIEKEVEAVLRKSHTEHFQWFETKLGIPMRDGLDVWPDFIEATERRNLFAHSGGIVSAQYVKVCAENGVPVSGVRLGVQLSVSRHYFENAYGALLEIGVKLSQVLWRKLIPNEQDAADSALNAISYELLLRRRYRHAIKLFDFAVETLGSRKRVSSEEYRRMFIVNRAQAYKWSGDAAKAKIIVDSEDWTACDPRFLLAVAVIRDDFALAAELMRRMGQKGAVAKADYIQWPLFREFRKSEDFRSAYQTVFGEDYPAVSHVISEASPTAERRGLPQEDAESA